MKILKKIVVLVLCICLILITLVTIINANTLLLNGNLYYDYCGESYKYNLATHSRRKIKLQGYCSIQNYFPLDGGYIAIGSKTVEKNDVNITKYDVIYYRNKEYKYIYDIEYPSCLSIINNYAFFISDNKLIKIDLNYFNQTNIYKYQFGVSLGYIFVDNYICFSDQKTINDEGDIFVCNYLSNKNTVKRIDRGIIDPQSINQLVYYKNGSCYRFDFENNKSLKEDNLKQTSINEDNRFLGKLSLYNNNYNVYYRSKRYTEVSLNERINGNDIGLLYIFYSYLKIDNNGKHYIIFLHNHYSDRVTVNAYVNNDTIVYLKKPPIPLFFS